MFWGLLFALPLFLAGLAKVLRAFAEIRFTPLPVFVSFVMIFAAVATFAFGRLWARSGTPLGFWRFLARCSINGLLICGIFILAMVCVNWISEERTSTRLLDYGWRSLGGSLFSNIIYQTLLGAIIRWRIRRAVQRPA